MGARKRSIARVSCRPGTGKVMINGVHLDAYEPEMARLMIKEPMIIAGDTANKIDFTANVQGGGIIGQASAIRQAISKLLVGHEKTLKKKFLDYDRSLLVADVRRTEPHKPSRSKDGPRTHKQRSKR